MLASLKCARLSSQNRPALPPEAPARADAARISLTRAYRLSGVGALVVDAALATDFLRAIMRSPRSLRLHFQQPGEVGGKLLAEHGFLRRTRRRDAGGGMTSRAALGAEHLDRTGRIDGRIALFLVIGILIAALEVGLHGDIGQINRRRLTARFVVDRLRQIAVARRGRRR